MQKILLQTVLLFHRLCHVQTLDQVNCIFVVMKNVKKWSRRKNRKIGKKKKHAEPLSWKSSRCVALVLIFKSKNFALVIFHLFCNVTKNKKFDPNYFYVALKCCERYCKGVALQMSLKKNLDLVFFFIWKFLIKGEEEVKTQPAVSYSKLITKYTKRICEIRSNLA